MAGQEGFREASSDHIQSVHFAVGIHLPRPALNDRDYRHRHPLRPVDGLDTFVIRKARILKRKILFDASQIITVKNFEDAGNELSEVEVWNIRTAGGLYTVDRKKGIINAPDTLIKSGLIPTSAKFENVDNGPVRIFETQRMVARLAQTSLQR